MLHRLYAVLTSLRLTVVCLVLAMVLVFWGTLAQVELGLYRVQKEFFQSLFVCWQPAGTTLRIPVFPGGYLLGGVLLANLILAHRRFYRATWRQAGIVLIHAGLVLLLVGQWTSDLLSVESVLHLREGETKNYSEMPRQVELAIVDTSDPRLDRVVAVPQSLLEAGGELRVAALPFGVRVRRFVPNAMLAERSPGDARPPAASQGAGARVILAELPPASGPAARDVPAAVIELLGAEGSLGTWLVSELLPEPQTCRVEGRSFSLAMRPRRLVKPYSLTLLEFRRETYPGTDIPREFSSRLRLRDDRTGEERQVLIYMNHPLRHGGETYYQADYDPDDRGTVLQVVRNPTWLTPYLACGLVSVGLIFQCLRRLLEFTASRWAA